MPLAWLASTAAFAQADPEAATCPPAVATEQRASAPVPPGSEAATDADGSHTLMVITIFAGPPLQHASLVGDERTGGKGRKVRTWALSATESYWVGCSDSRTNIMLQRRLPQGLNCSVIYDTQVRIGGLPPILKIACRGTRVGPAPEKA